MDCKTARELISAQIDEDSEQLAEPEAHLAVCTECQAWKEHAHGLTRRLIRTAPQPGPRRPIVLRPPRGSGRYRATRLILAWIGVLLIAWNLPDLFAGGVDVTLIHLSRHQNAFSLALGTTFLFVAWRPDRAYGMVPMAAVFALAIAGATIDLINGASTLGRESIHLVEILGLVLVWILGISAGPGRRKRHPHGLTSITDQPD